jgi:hypothetical protein
VELIMLVDFRVENHRSLRDEQGFTLEASNVDGDVLRIRDAAGLHILPVLAVYGANASGKSNVLAALHFMRDAVVLSHRFWSPTSGVPRQPFAWGAVRETPSLFQATLLIDNVRHEYGFVLDDQQVLEEWLHAWPNGRKQIWFEREDGVFKFGEHLHGENRTVQDVTRPNGLFLSAAAQNNHKQLDPVFRWFNNLRSEGVRSYDPSLFSEGPANWLSEGPQASLFDEPHGTRMTRFREMLQTADIGIVDIRMSSPERTSSQRQFRGPKIQLRHQNSAPDAWLPLREESHGTRQIFELGPLVIHALEQGGLLLVDELESALHPLLAAKFVRAFNDPIENPKNAQLIFTTHDTNLLGTLTGEPPLRRDQVWLTEKDDEGGTRLFPMTDYKPRKSENLERGYLQGRYGAIPFLGALTLTGER